MVLLLFSSFIEERCRRGKEIKNTIDNETAKRVVQVDNEKNQ